MTPSVAILRTPVGWGLMTDGQISLLAHPLADMLAGAPVQATDMRLDGDLLAPVDRQEVWASGVTYENSLGARVDESKMPDHYTELYRADRPELFQKSVPARVVGPGGTGLIRTDSDWNVPEPELALVVDSAGSIFGYSIGDDISSRSIEGANPLYLPQAKVYQGSCVLGPWIVPADTAIPPFGIRMTIERDSQPLFCEEISTSQMARSFEDLVGWLFAGLSFPHGVILLTGTGIVPPPDVTLRAGDRVVIEVSAIGTLVHDVGDLRVSSSPTDPRDPKESHD